MGAKNIRLHCSLAKLLQRFSASSAVAPQQHWSSWQSLLPKSGVKWNILSTFCIHERDGSLNSLRYRGKRHIFTPFFMIKSPKGFSFTHQIPINTNKLIMQQKNDQCPVCWIKSLAQNVLSVAPPSCSIPTQHRKQIFWCIAIFYVYAEWFSGSAWQHSCRLSSGPDDTLCESERHLEAVRCLTKLFYFCFSLSIYDNS